MSEYRRIYASQSVRRPEGGMTELEVERRLDAITEKDSELATRGVPAPGAMSRIRIFSPGWHPSCLECERNNRNCVTVTAGCPDDVATMQLVAYRRAAGGGA